MDTLRDLSHNTIFAGFVLLMTSLIIAYMLYKKRRIFRSFNPTPEIAHLEPVKEEGELYCT
ncbi:MAG: hypothetical protein K940chlam9_00143 [Chlamydiae bacterium]|nr:hypothetical protein [Chlamydiota bacterium]